MSLDFTKEIETLRRIKKEKFDQALIENNETDKVYNYTFADISVYFHLKDSDVLDVYIVDDVNIGVEYTFNTHICVLDILINRETVEELYMKYQAHKISNCF